MPWWPAAFASVSKSQSRDDSVISSDHGKYRFFSATRRHRLLTRAKKKLLQPIDVGSPGHPRNHSPRPAVASSTTAPASPLPLPLPELHVLLQRDPKPAPANANSCSVPLPSPDAIKIHKDCDEREKEATEAAATEAIERQGAHNSRIVGQESSRKTENREKKHVKTASLENYVNIPSSAPSSPYAGLEMSPPRNDMWGVYNMTPPPGLFQLLSAPDLPKTDNSAAGFSRHTRALSLDNSPIRSPRLMASPSPPRLRETNAVHPLPLPPAVSMPAFPTPSSPIAPVPRPDPSGASLPSQTSPVALHFSMSDFSPSAGSKPELVPAKSKWQKGKLIGRGTFGSVYVASNRLA